MTEIQMKIAELKIEYAEQKLTETDGIDHRSRFEAEEYMFDYIISRMEIYAIAHDRDIILEKLSKGQRKRFFERMAVVMAYDMNGMEEREFILNTKLLIYAI